MDELVEIINQLQDVFSVSGSSGIIDLPQIVVVGSQSSGKSSVLEHIVGKSFLPRGVGIVTRCPLILQLVHAPNEDEEYAIFQQNTSKKLTDFSFITKAIEDETDRLAGANKGICPTPISLRLYSPKVLNLTLVDLPGLTKVPVGDQPEDIEIQTRDLIMDYIKNPNSIILAVTPANVDMATSESLKLAREVDPEGSRTLAVITKIDLMDQGTDAWDMLSGKVIPVKRGIIGVVNRSQKDIQEDKSIDESLKDEEKFFNTHYKSIASTNGCPYLMKKVQAILVNHIKNCMPELREKIKDKLRLKNKELEKIKDSAFDKQTLLLDLIIKFSNAYNSSIKGYLNDTETEELYGGATIKRIFQKNFSTALNNVKALKGLKKRFILTAMENSSGINPAIFIPEVAFESLVKKQIEKLRSPCLNCVESVHKELSKISEECIEEPGSMIELYPKLMSGLDKVVTDLLQSQISMTNQMINNLIDVETAHINTVHPDFFPNSGENLSLSNKENKSSDGGEFCEDKDYYEDEYDGETKESCEDKDSDEDESDEESNLQSTFDDKMRRDYHLIRKLIRSYFGIVRKSVQDIVPKIIMHFLVNHSMEHLHFELIKWMNNSNADDILQELDTVTEKRKDLKKEIVALEKANDIINNFSSVARVRYNL